jgi:urease accessory protein
MTLAFRPSALTAALAALPLAAGPAAAHHAMGEAVPATLWQGLASGLAHPVIGPDHLAFLVAVGLAAGIARHGPALPLLFVAASVLGVAAHWLGLVMPGAELLVGATVLAAGAPLARGRAPDPRVWAALLAVGGLAHGQAYAEAVIGAEPTPVLAYLAGLALVQGAITGGVALLPRRRSAAVAGTPAVRLAGFAVVLVGAVALAGRALAGG